MSLYSAYGLQIDSELPLPGLLPGSKRPADVEIRLGSVPNSLPNPIGKGGYFEATDDAFLFRVKDVARYLVIKGRQIIIDRFPDSHEDVLRTYLMGSVFGALMHQRHLLVMHASSIQTTHGAALFVGPSGHGKSTLLAALADRGYAMLADDVTAIEADSRSVPLAFPSFPRMRLNADAATRIGYGVDSLPRLQHSGKYLVPVEHFCKEALPVHAVYVLEVHEEEDIRIEQVDALQRFAIVANNTYRYGFLDSLGLRQIHFRAAARLAKSVQVRRIIRPGSFFSVDKMVEGLSVDFGEPVHATQKQEVS